MGGRSELRKFRNSLPALGKLSLSGQGRRLETLGTQITAKQEKTGDPWEEVRDWRPHTPSSSTHELRRPSHEGPLTILLGGAQHSLGRTRGCGVRPKSGRAVTVQDARGPGCRPIRDRTEETEGPSSALQFRRLRG